MALLKLLLLTLPFHELIVVLDAIVCLKGQKINDKKNLCEVCPDGYYQNEEIESLTCKICTKCEEIRGSFIKKECTKETDTICTCRSGFVPWEPDSSACKCDIGFGLRMESRNGQKIEECSECAYGYFSKQINSPCKKWKECKSGVNKNGTRTSDVICNELKRTPDNATPYIISSTTHRPHEKNHIQTVPTTTTTRAPQGPTVPTKQKEKMKTVFPSYTGNHTGMVFLMFGIVGLLVLTTVTCKLYIIPCVQREPPIQTKDSLCRRPVEESGSGSLSPLKLNSGEP